LEEKIKLMAVYREISGKIKMILEDQFGEMFVLTIDELKERIANHEKCGLDASGERRILKKIIKSEK